ncbi:histidine triad nucleotide-binding protein [Grosmannia clavigera kw1407]|uniref:Histidine triad nucleotide-binding protein n=1 Tax=Grosmannia clavigera (strain kw1407 / UAMH 11150) TaxID=655863 RepID=F0XMD7_GROCL|nr:histidine triad nucleotide-binding protein [Grosmannia clavigera kw1407]EFX01093.1 histidine triad nucleotide-binding protein [Grosmannia clavigera kw1407]
MANTAQTKHDKDAVAETTSSDLAEATATKKRRDTNNAFSELMRPKRPKLDTPASTTGRHHNRFFAGSDGLGVYISDPAAHLMDGPAATADGGSASGSRGSRVIFFTADFVAIHDLYPKATVHCLLLPRDRRFNRQHPLEVLSRQSDEAASRFLAGLRAAAEQLRTIVAAELRRQLGAGSAQDAAREAFMRGEGMDEDGEGEVGGDPPPGRDWAAEVLVGVHAHPSMSHLHVHVLSRDMHSDRLRNSSHYNSFTTPFFVPLDAFPLAASDPRHSSDSLHQSMACWRCGRQFGNRFADLKRHLEQEFQAWKRE